MVAYYYKKKIDAENEKTHLDDLALKNLSFGWKIPCKTLSYLVYLEDNTFDNFNFYTVFEFTRHMTETIHLLQNSDKNSDCDFKNDNDDDNFNPCFWN